MRLATDAFFSPIRLTLAIDMGMNVCKDCKICYEKEIEEKFNGVRLMLLAKDCFGEVAFVSMFSFELRDGARPLYLSRGGVAHPLVMEPCVCLRVNRRSDKW